MADNLEEPFNLPPNLDIIDEPYFRCNVCGVLVALQFDLACNYGIGSLNAKGWFHLTYNTVTIPGDNEFMELRCAGCQTKLGVAFNLQGHAVSQIPIMADMGSFVVDMSSINFVALMMNPRRRALLPAINAVPFGGNPNWESEEFKKQVNAFVNLHQTFAATKDWIIH